MASLSGKEAPSFTRTTFLASLWAKRSTIIQKGHDHSEPKEAPSSKRDMITLSQKERHHPKGTWSLWAKRSAIIQKGHHHSEPKEAPSSKRDTIILSQKKHDHPKWLPSLCAKEAPSSKRDTIMASLWAKIKTTSFKRDTPGDTITLSQKKHHPKSTISVSQSDNKGFYCYQVEVRHVRLITAISK